jgi:hypothetical protein
MRQDNPTKLFQPDTAEAVLKETLEILKLISPNFNLVTVIDVFNAANRIYNGKYPGYRACNTDYHDFPHVCAVFLAMARLSHGAVIDKMKFSERYIVLGLIAAIMHDVGYIQEEFDREGTGAKYTASHVQRSMDFLSCHGSDLQWIYLPSDFRTLRPNFLAKCWEQQTFWLSWQIDYIWRNFYSCTTNIRKARLESTRVN